MHNWKSTEKWKEEFNFKIVWSHIHPQVSSNEVHEAHGKLSIKK